MQEPTHSSDSGKEPKNQSTHKDNLLVAAKGGSITFVGKLFTHIVGLGFAVLIARTLGAEQYGLFRLTLSLSMIITAVSFLGLDGGIKRFLPIARSNGDEARVWGIIQLGLVLPAIAGLLITLILFFSAELISIHIFDSPELVPVFMIGVLAIPFRVVSQSLASFAVAFKRVEFDVYAREFVFIILKFVFAVAAIYLGTEILGVTAGYVLAAAMTTPLLFYYVHKIFPLTRSIASAVRDTAKIIRFSLPLFLSHLVNQLGRKFETVILGIFGVMADVGVFSVILTISTIGTMGFVALRKVSAPIFSELHSQKRFDELRSIYQTITKWALAFNIPIFLTVVLFSDHLLLLFGKEFMSDEASIGMLILAFGTLFSTSTGACGNLITMSGHSKVTLYNTLGYLAATIFFDFLFIPRWGLVGAAWAGSLSVILVNVLRVIEVYVLVERLLPFNWSFLKPLGAALVASILAYFLNGIIFVDQLIPQLLVSGSAMWLVYIGLVIAMKLSPEDQMIMRKVFKKGNKKKKQK